MNKLVATANTNKTEQQEVGTSAKHGGDDINVINNEKTKQMGVLAGPISSINADTEELNEKGKRNSVLTSELPRSCHQCSELTLNHTLVGRGLKCEVAT